jgi:DNA-binding transcriptional LysR family regulator
MVQSLVAAGLAVALLPEAALQVVTRPGVAVREVTDAGRRHLSLVHHPDAAGTPALRALLSALRPPRS